MDNGTYNANVINKQFKANDTNNVYQRYKTSTIFLPKFQNKLLALINSSQIRSEFLKISSSNTMNDRECVTSVAQQILDIATLKTLKKIIKIFISEYRTCIRRKNIFDVEKANIESIPANAVKKSIFINFISFIVCCITVHERLELFNQTKENIRQDGMQTVNNDNKDYTPSQINRTICMLKNNLPDTKQAYEKKLIQKILQIKKEVDMQQYPKKLVEHTINFLEFSLYIFTKANETKREIIEKIDFKENFFKVVYMQFINLYNFEKFADLERNYFVSKKIDKENQKIRCFLKFYGLKDDYIDIIESVEPNISQPSDKQTNNINLGSKVDNIIILVILVMINLAVLGTNIILTFYQSNIIIKISKDYKKNIYKNNEKADIKNSKKIKIEKRNHNKLNNLNN